MGWIRFDRSSWGFSRSIVLFDKVNMYVGKTDHWGISIALSFYERSLTIELLNWYAGIEVWHSE